MIPPPPPHQDVIEQRIIIKRPVGEVFAFYTDFSNLPRFLGDVMAVQQIGPATYRWIIQGPLGIRVKSAIRVTEIRPNKAIYYETDSAGTLKGYWEIHFAPGPHAGETKVREVMQVPLGRLGRLALALIGKHPTREVSSNLRRLKELMETGRVTDTSNSVAGKFAER